MTDSPDTTADGTADRLNLWAYDPDNAVWQVVHNGTRAALAELAQHLVDAVTSHEDNRQAWVITHANDVPPAVLDPADPDVFTTYPTPAPAPDWHPLAGLIAAQTPAVLLPEEPPIGTVLTWTTRNNGFAQAAFRYTATAWAVTETEDARSWPELVAEIQDMGVRWDQVGVAMSWAPFTDRYNLPPGP